MRQATVFSVLNKATVGDLGGMHQPNELVFTRMSSGGKGPHPQVGSIDSGSGILILTGVPNSVWQRVLSLEVVEEDDESGMFVVMSLCFPRILETTHAKPRPDTENFASNSQRHARTCPSRNRCCWAVF